jgi:hypothetical protein
MSAPVEVAGTDVFRFKAFISSILFEFSDG